MVASAGPSQYEQVIPVALASPDIDSLLVMYTPIDVDLKTATLEAIGRGVAAARTAGTTKPVIACTLSVATEPPPIPAGRELVPTCMFPENAAIALGRAAAYSEWRRAPAPHVDTDDAPLTAARAWCDDIATRRGDTWLTHHELQRLLALAGLELPGIAARTASEAVAVADGIGYPVAIKIDAAGIVHKSERRGVLLDVPDHVALRKAFADFDARFPELRMDGTASVIVQPMCSGVETLIGMVEDPIFGPLVAFGLGGVAAEVLRDVAFRLAPLSHGDIDAMLHGIRGFPLLQEFRHRPAADVDALRVVLQRVSRLACDVPALRELDLNPVIVRPRLHGCVIVDARARVAPVRVPRNDEPTR